MKGIILASFRDYFLKKTNNEVTWKDILDKSGLGSEKIILHSVSLDDKYVKPIIDGMSEKLMMNKSELLIELGKFFIISTATRFYKTTLMKYNTFEDFILNVNKIHSSIVQMMPDATPPVFGIEFKNNKIVIDYTSKRHLIDYAYGALLGAAALYKSNAKITKLNDNKIEILL